MKIKLKDKTIVTLNTNTQEDIEWIKKKAEELSPTLENFASNMGAALKGKVGEEFFEKKIYLKTFGEVNEFIDTKLHGLFAAIQQKYEVRKPFKIVLWDMISRAGQLSVGDRYYHEISAIACRLIDTFYHIQRHEAESRDGDEYRFAKTELESRGYFGAKIRQEHKNIYGDMEL